MPRVNTVEKSRKSPGACGRCRQVIAAGDGYRHWSFRYGGKVVRCLACPSPRASELTNSDKLARLYQCEEEVTDAQGREPGEGFESYRERMADAVRAAGDKAREVADEYREALDAWEHGNSQLEEKTDAAESYADELDSAADAIEGVEVEVDDDEAPDAEELAELIEGAVGEIDDLANSAAASCEL